MCRTTPLVRGPVYGTAPSLPVAGQVDLGQRQSDIAPPLAGPFDDHERRIETAPGVLGDQVQPTDNKMMSSSMLTTYHRAWPHGVLEQVAAAADILLCRRKSQQPRGWELGWRGREHYSTFLYTDSLPHYMEGALRYHLHT